MKRCAIPGLFMLFWVFSHFFMIGGSVGSSNLMFSSTILSGTFSVEGRGQHAPQFEKPNGIILDAADRWSEPSVLVTLAGRFSLKVETLKQFRIQIPLLLVVVITFLAAFLPAHNEPNKSAMDKPDPVTS